MKRALQPDYLTEHQQQVASKTRKQIEHALFGLRLKFRNLQIRNSTNMIRKSIYYILKDF